MKLKLIEDVLLVSEWHYEKNISINIEDIVIGSGKKVWWKCVNGHEWENIVNKRAIRKQGCPYCSGKKASYQKNLTLTNPELVEEWDFSTNLLQPQIVTYGSEKKVNWVCKYGHKWAARINHRTKGIGCPICGRLKAGIDNNITITHPNISKEWHFEKNYPLNPNEFLYGSEKKVWWLCNLGHEWELKINKRTIRNQNCLICSNRKVNSDYNLQKMYPDISKQWDFDKNIGKYPYQFLPNSNVRVWWKCNFGDDHEWECTINNRVAGNNCPICSGKKVANSNSLQTINAKLSEEWHTTKNGSLTPSDFVANSNKEVWWKCKVAEDHEWKASIVNRNRGRGCPMCRGLSVVNSNSLATTHPSLSTEWHPSKNLDLNSKNVVAGSHIRVWWQCNKNQSHEWFASIKNRTLKKHGCPFCTLISQSKQELVILFELKSIFHSISPQGFRFKEGKKRFNIDIFINELNLGIEYDGSYWHRDKLTLDTEKIDICKNRGMALWRIREEPLKVISLNDIISQMPFSPKIVVDALLIQIRDIFLLNLSKRQVESIEIYLALSSLANTLEFQKFVDNLLIKKAKKDSLS